MVGGPSACQFANRTIESRSHIILLSTKYQYNIHVLTERCIALDRCGLRARPAACAEHNALRLCVETSISTHTSIVTEGVMRRGCVPRTATATARALQAAALLIVAL